MPIRAEMRALYPREWPAIRARMLARAHGRCEWCGIANAAWGYRTTGGVFVAVPMDLVRLGRCLRPPMVVAALDDDGTMMAAKLFRVVLTIAHVDHDPTHNDETNLAALCQRCHNRHDRAQRQATRARTQAALAALG